MRPLRFRILAALILVTGSFSLALAVDPGRVEGRVTVNDEIIELTHVIVHLHDNVEGILDRTPELRICLTDREVPPAALRGIAFLPISQMAKKGEAKGVLLEMDPSKPGEVVTTLLYPADPGNSLMTMTSSNDPTELWSKFEIGDDRLSGATSESAEMQIGWVDSGLRFDAPLFHEPEVTADLKDGAAQSSGPVKALRARSEAMAAGDVETVRALSTVDSIEQMEAYRTAQGLSDDQLVEMMKSAGAGGLPFLDKIVRVIERGESAIAIFDTGDGGSQWATLQKEDGVWKSVN